MSSTVMKTKKSKTLYIITIALAFVMIFTSSVPVPALAATSTYKKTGYVFPEVIGLGARDVISFTVRDGRINGVTVSQVGGSCLGLINVVPDGYYMKSSNTLITNWRLTVSAPVKFLGLEAGIRYKTVEYKLGTNGNVSMRVVRNTGGGGSMGGR